MRLPHVAELGAPAALVRRGGPPLAWPLRILAALVRAGVVIAVATVLVFTVGQVIDRHFFQTGFSAFDQYARLGLVWMTFLGIAIAFRERVNIRIELLDHFLSDGLIRRKTFILDIVVLIVAITLIVVGWPLLEVGAFQVLMDTPFTYEVMYGALIVGLAFLVVFLSARVVDVLTGGRFQLDHQASDDDHH